MLTYFPYLESCHFRVFLKCHSWLCDFTFTTLTAKSISIYSLPWLLTLPLCPRFFKNCRNGKVSYWKPKHRKKRYLVYSERGIQWHIPYVWICKGTCSIVLFSWISHNQFSQLHRDFFFFEVWIMTLLQLQLYINWHFYLKILTEACSSYFEFPAHNTPNLRQYVILTVPFKKKLQ